MEEEILTTAVASPVAGKVFNEIGSLLPGILSGCIGLNSLPIVGDKASAFADDVLRVQFLNSSISSWFNMAGYKYSGFRVLETGSGSVSMTVSVLQKPARHNSLPHRVKKYTYTRVASGCASQEREFKRMICCGLCIPGHSCRHCLSRICGCSERCCALHRCLARYN